MKTRKKTLFRSVILMLCCVMLCSTAFAAMGSLRVTVLDEKTPVENIAVELCRVADLEGDTFTLTEAFADLHLSPQDMAQERSAEQAEQVYQYVMHWELEGSVILTDREGNADFLTIEDGLYLVFERGGQAIAFRPYLVTLPTDGRYGVYSAPKTDSGEVRSISVFKEWDDEENKAGKRPESVEITLYRNGVPVRSVVLNEACGWEHTFIMLPAEGEYSVSINDIPSYTTTIEEVFEGFLITSKYRRSPGPGPDVPDDPDVPDIPVYPDEIPTDPQQPPKVEEDVPTLPQTGFKMWPVYGMLGLGVALTVLGLVDVCLGKEASWEEEQEES